MRWSATVRAASDSVIYEFNDAASFLNEQPAVALLIARLLAQRVNVATTYLADLMKQYAGHGTHLEKWYRLRYGSDPTNRLQTLAWHTVQPYE